MSETDKLLTMEEFIVLLWNAFCERLGRTSGDGLVMAAAHGWAEPQDLRLSKRPIRRNAAARLLHEFLMRELGEEDEENWNAAEKLKDLYDCRVCVRHVAQVYVKGIMSAKGESFGMQEGVTRKEALEMTARTLDRKRRAKVKTQDGFKAQGESPARDDSPEQDGSKARELSRVREGLGYPKKLSRAQAGELRTAGKDLIFLDVRTAGEYAAGHPEDAKNAPLLRLMSHPEEFLESRKGPILLGCDGGYRSEMAANFLESLGYREVCHYGWGEDYVL